MSAPTQILPPHHRHCDDLFAAAEEAARRRDWDTAQAAFARFNAQMLAHFTAEEDLLFPAFEDATGMSGGPTEMMRYEHGQMRDLLEELGEACRTRNGDAYSGTAETLLMLMQQHNMKEENILYPMCDQALGGDAARVSAQITDVLEKADA